MATLTDSKIVITREQLLILIAELNFSRNRPALQEARWLRDAWVGDEIAVEKGSLVAEAIAVIGARRAELALR